MATVRTVTNQLRLWKRQDRLCASRAKKILPSVLYFDRAWGDKVWPEMESG